MSTIGLGSTLEINDGAASAFVDVTNLVDIDPPDDVMGAAESKRLDLASDTITAVPTVKNPGEFSFTYEYDDGTEFDRIDALKGVAKSFKFTPNGGTAKTVPGFVTSNKMNQVVADQIMTATTTVRVTGPAS